MSETIVALIPARSGSKSIRDKNIVPFRGIPLLAHSIRHALESKCISRVIVSTDSEEYASIAREYGAETPFIRPKNIATDRALDVDVFLHALNWLERKQQFLPEICVHLRPTYPIRNPSDIDNAIRLLQEDKTADSIRSISPSPHTPYKMWKMEDGRVLVPVIASEIPEAYNMPRQELPETYIHNGCIDVVRSSVITEKHSMTGSKILGYMMDENFDIDDIKDFEYAAASVLPSLKGKIYIFDVDGVLATYVRKNDFESARALQDSINIVNQLYARGNRILLHSNLGTSQNSDRNRAFEKMIQDWGVKYHEVIYSDLQSDYCITDRSTSLFNIRRALEIEHHES
jgi:CMP-N,N'-diacetyllegionaminic acid synthase